MRVAGSIILLTAALWVSGPRPATLLVVYLAAVTPELWTVDVRERRLPNRLVLPGYAVAAVAVTGQWWLGGGVPLTAVLSGAAYGGFLMLLSVAGGMGMGDVKLAGVLGVAAGLLGPEAAVASPLVAFIAGGAVAAVRLARGGARTSIPFGPYLLAGFWVALLLSPGASST